MNLDAFDRSLMAATQSGLPIEPHPYDTVGTRLGVSGATVREHLAAMLAQGLIRRIGVVPNHYRLGFTANGMTVWDVDDAQVDTLGPKVGALPFVSHCYRRPRVLPDWPYNLFAMVHGRTRADVERHALEIHCLLAGNARAFDVLYSTRILKKTGVRIATAAE